MYGEFAATKESQCGQKKHEGCDPGFYTVVHAESHTNIVAQLKVVLPPSSFLVSDDVCEGAEVGSRP